MTVSFAGDWLRADGQNQKRLTVRGKLPIRLAVLAMILGLLSASARAALADTAPTQATKAMVEQALQILRDKSVPVVERRRQLRAVIEPRMDFREMSRSALGYNWRALTPQQRADFTTVFTAFIEDAYLSKIQDYSGQRVEYLRQNSLGDGYSQVDTAIVQPGKQQSLKVAYLLERTGPGDWKVYDVTVDNISIIANYRNQFNRVINDQGFDKLMEQLRSKQKELATLVGDAN
jgi:phospholipid transport system substrate-binding protein